MYREGGECCSLSSRQFSRALARARRWSGLMTLDETVALARSGADGREWYARARSWLVRTFGDNAPIMAQFLAATSPRASVRCNLRHALRALGAYVRREAPPTRLGVPANDANVARAFRGEALTGPKVGPFARALAGDPDACPVDVWIARAFGAKGDAPTEPERREYVARIRDASAVLGWSVAETQAAVWCAVRRRATRSHGAETYPSAYRRIQHADARKRDATIVLECAARVAS